MGESTEDSNQDGKIDTKYHLLLQLIIHFLLSFPCVEIIEQLLNRIDQLESRLSRIEFAQNTIMVRLYFLYEYVSYQTNDSFIC